MATDILASEALAAASAQATTVGTMVTVDLLTAFAVAAPLGIMLWYFFRRFVERMDALEAKIDGMVEFRVKTLSSMVTRPEHSQSIGRLHTRIDEMQQEYSEISARLAKIEGGQEQRQAGAL